MLQFQSQILVDNVPDEMLDNKWECILPSLDLDTSLGGIPYRPIVEEISFSNTSFSNEEFRTATRFYNLPSDRESFGSCTLTLFCEQGMLPLYYLQTWRNLMFNSKHQYYYGNENDSNSKNLINSIKEKTSEYADNKILQTSKWKRNIEIYFYGIGSTIPVSHATLYNAYPITHGKFNLKYSSEPGRFKINADFRYDNIIWDSKYREIAIISALGAGNPAGTVLQQLVSQGLGSLMSSDTMMEQSHEAL